MNKLLSICIPTYGRVEILRNTLDSIYSQSVDANLFEVCISDNSPTNETEEMLHKYFYDKINLVYKKSSCEGYLNSIEALKLGCGQYLKLHNNYTKFKKGMLSKFLRVIEEYFNQDCVVFGTFGSIKQSKVIESYCSFNDFMNCITYFSTWSTSFGVWKEKFDLIIQYVKLDKMFPHTSILFEQINEKNYIVDNTDYFDNQDVGKKGGYNLPETFGTRYLGMVQALFDKKEISEITLNNIKLGILKFIASWYLNVKVYSNKYTFSFENWEKIVSDIYGEKGCDFVINYYKHHKLKVEFKKLLGRY